jgi:hypothetical protein
MIFGLTSRRYFCSGSGGISNGCVFACTICGAIVLYRYSSFCGPPGTGLRFADRRTYFPLTLQTAVLICENEIPLNWFVGVRLNRPTFVCLRVAMRFNTFSTSFESCSFYLRALYNVQWRQITRADSDSSLFRRAPKKLNVSFMFNSFLAFLS